MRNYYNKTDQFLSEYFYRSLANANQLTSHQYKQAIITYNSLRDLLYTNKLLFKKLPKYDIAKVFLGLGISYFNLNDYPKAKEHFELALQYDNASQDIFFYSGLTEYHLKNYQKAIENFSKVIQLPGIVDQSELFYNRGLCYFEQNNFIKAIQDFTKALSASPNEPLVLYSRSLAYYSESKCEQAIKDLEKALLLQPDFVDALQFLGTIRLDECQYGKAMEIFKHILEIDNHNHYAEEKLKFVVDVDGRRDVGGGC